MMCGDMPRQTLSLAALLPVSWPAPNVTLFVTTAAPAARYREKEKGPRPLATEAQLAEDCAIALGVIPVEVREQPAPPADDLQQAPSGVVVVAIGLEVLRDLPHPRCHERDLDFR